MIIGGLCFVTQEQAVMDLTAIIKGLIIGKDVKRDVRTWSAIHIGGQNEC